MELTDKHKVLRDLPDTYGDTGAHSHVIEGPWIDVDGVEYRKVGEFLSDTDFYQGLNMVTVIGHPDGRYFGYFWWDDISKYGESYIDGNMYDFGWEYEDDQEQVYIWTEVRPFVITGYEEKE